jgi:anti-anti-sigma regulatory factor
MTAVSDPPSATVVLDGEIDIATSPAIREPLMAAINAGNVHLAVDMRYRCCGRPGEL